jgi:hypothetical protein
LLLAIRASLAAATVAVAEAVILMWRAIRAAAAAATLLGCRRTVIESLAFPAQAAAVAAMYKAAIAAVVAAEVCLKGREGSAEVAVAVAVAAELG